MLIFLTVLILLEMKFAKSHVCGTDSLEKNERKLMKTNTKLSHGLANSNEEWKPLRIHLDFSQIDPKKIGNFSLEHVDFLKEKVLPRTIKIFEKLITTRPIVGNLTFTDNPCGKIKKIPEMYWPENGGVEADLVIFVLLDETGTYEEKGIEASALHCFQDDVTFRPIVGYITYKPTFEKNTPTALDYMTWLTLHEMTHILAFNDGLFEDWIDGNRSRRGKSNVVQQIFFWGGGRNMTILVTPEVLKQSRKHYNCPLLRGAFLENKGGSGTAGSHWMKKTMNTDYMTGDNYGESFISKMTLAVFVDSGWYRADMKMANQFMWGKDQGCPFIDKDFKCVWKLFGRINLIFKNSYCKNLNKPICSNSHTFRGVCATKHYKNQQSFTNYFDGNEGGADELMDRCPIAIEETNDMSYHGGSCRDGSDKNIKRFEKVCPNCACFNSDLKEINPPKEIINSDKEKVQQKKNISGTEASFLERKLKKKKKWNFFKNLIQKAAINTIKFADNAKKAIDSAVADGANNIKAIKELGLVNFAKGAIQTGVQLVGATVTGIHDTITNKKDPNYNAMCFEFKCEGGEIKVIILNKEYKCQDNKTIKIDGFTGEIQCPPKHLLCDQRYFWKFGGTEKDQGDKEESKFSKLIRRKK